MHQVERPFLEHDLKGGYFLAAKRNCVLAVLLFSLFLNPITLELLSPQLTREYVEVLFEHWEVVLILGYFYVYFAVAVPALHEERRGRGPSQKFLAAARSGDNKALIIEGLRTSSLGFHLFVNGFAVIAAICFVVIPVGAVSALGAPVALFVFVWIAFMVAFCFFDLSSAGRIAGLALLLVVVTGPEYGIRDIRLDPDLRAHPAKLSLPDEGPIFVIAADGGGIRAAYWTTALLGQIAAAYPDFTQRIVAVGGTSGGSVGVGLFSALLEAGVPDDQLGAKAAEVLSVDYVSIAAANLVWRDFITRAFCLRSLMSWLSVCRNADDRITAIEKRMEREFEAVTGQPTLAGSVPSTPRAFFVSTEVGTGRAFVLSAQDAGFSKTSIGVPNPATLLVDDIPMSTAMFVSARFPLVSPDARVRVEGDGTVFQVSGNADAAQLDLIDGGYADNTGTVAILPLVTSGELYAPGVSSRVFVLSIANDPSRSLPDTQVFQDHVNCARMAEDDDEGNALRLVGSPLKTLDGVRARNSEAQRARLKSALGPRLVTVPFIGCEGATPVPLGWTLSAASREDMDEQAVTLMAEGSPLVQWLQRAYAP